MTCNLKFGVLAAAAALLAAVDVISAGPASGRAVPPRARLAADPVSPPRTIVARRMRPRPGAIAAGTRVSASVLFPNRVFVNGRVGFALANEDSAQYPALTTDGGRRWRIAGPQFHIDAADAPEGVGYVGAATPRTFYAYGSSVADVSTDAGHTWWEAYLGELVMAVVTPAPHDLVAYVEQQVGSTSTRRTLIWQYVSRDGGRRWSYSTTLGGLFP
jgi:hypothetical protein